MSKKKKIILIISIIILIIILAGGTTAFFGWRAEKEATVSVTIASGEGNCSLKTDNNILIAPSLTKNNGRIIKLKASQNLGAKASITWNMKIKAIGELQDASFKYEMINTSTGVSYGTGTFADIASGDTITFSNVEEALGFGLQYEFTLYLWIDGSLGDYQSTLANQTLDFDINCDIMATETGTINRPQEPSSITAVEYIRNLYNNTTLTPITQTNTLGGLEGKYYYNTKENLMNDNMEKDGNIRYYGADPDNYIYFNCDDYTSQSEETCEKWRIVGVFDNKLKIVRAEPLGKFSWDYTKEQEYDAEWHNATLNKLLNDDYYNNKDNVTFYYYTTGFRTGHVNFATDKTGIKNDETRNLISDSTWYLGAWDVGNIYPPAVYGYERGYERCTTCNNKTTWTGKIAPLYASDYGFASDLRQCQYPLTQYNEAGCYDTNWQYVGATTFFLTTHHELPYYVWGQRSSGYIRTGTYARIWAQISPSLYLDPSTKFTSNGKGTSDNPYQIDIYKDFTITYENRNTIGNPEETPDLVIPSTFQGEDGALYRVTAIDEYAFDGYSEEGEPNWQKLTSITIPDSVTTIDGWLFGEYSFVEHINVDENNKNFVSIDGVLYTKDESKIIAYPPEKSDLSFTIPNGVTFIGDASFASTRHLTHVIVPGSVTTIGNDAFMFSSVEEVTLSNGLINIGAGAFALSNNLTNINIPNTVTSIGNYAFEETQFTSIIIPKSVTKIGEGVFYNCWSLENIYYTGTEEEWNQIEKSGWDNGLFEEGIEPTIHYNYVPS